MIIADKLRRTNRAEFLLYMWQVEDVLRAYGCDAERIGREYLVRFDMTDEVRAEATAWYADLCRMMLEEGLREHGHLPVSRSALQELQELHDALLASPKFPYYREMYYRVLPYIVELRAKRGGGEVPELETCFEALYGALMLKLRGKPVSDDTQKALHDISALLGQLSDYYFKDKESSLELK